MVNEDGFESYLIVSIIRLNGFNTITLNYEALKDPYETSLNYDKCEYCLFSECNSKGWVNDIYFYN